MTFRSVFLTVGAALVLAGCVDRGDWKATPKVEPNTLSAEHTLQGTKLDAGAWPADQWWRDYGDPQLDALVDEALAGSPSLEIAQARLRAAQGQAVSAGGARARRGRQRGADAPALPRARPVPAAVRRQLVDRCTRGAGFQLGPGFLGPQPCATGAGTFRGRGRRGGPRGGAAGADRGSRARLRPA